MKSAREVLSSISTKFHTFPFTIRVLDEKKGRFGISECLKHDLLSPWPVLYEKGGEVVAHLKTTVLIQSSSVEPICTLGFPAPSPASEKLIVNQSVRELLERGLQFAKKKSNKKKKKAPAAGGASAPGSESATKQEADDGGKDEPDTK